MLSSFDNGADVQLLLKVPGDEGTQEAVGLYGVKTAFVRRKICQMHHLSDVKERDLALA